MSDILYGVVGVLMIGLVASDVFRSLLVPRASGRALRVAPVLGLVLFGVWHRLARFAHGHDAQQRFRAMLAPLMLVLLLAVWVALLVVGFGLLFWVGRRDFNPIFGSIDDALFASGSAFSTLGVQGSVSGDVMRFVLLVCSVSGLAVVTVVATFLISVQNGFARRETLVLRLEAHVTLPPAGVAILEAYAHEAIAPRLGAFFAAWEEWSAEVATSHKAFPILLFFRSNDSRCEWLAAIGAVLDAAALIDATVDDASPESRAGAHFVLRTGGKMVCDLAHEIAQRYSDNTVLFDEQRFDDHRRRLADAGYTLVEDRHAALVRFTERRDRYAPALSALGRQLRIDIDERRASEDSSGPME